MRNHLLRIKRLWRLILAVQDMEILLDFTQIIEDLTNSDHLRKQILSYSGEASSKLCKEPAKQVRDLCSSDWKFM